MPPPLFVRLAQIVSRPVPDRIRDRTQLHVMDWAGCAVAGAATPVGRAFRQAAEPGHCVSLGQDAGLSPRSAAFTMGAYGNPLEMDDVDRQAILHPGPVIVPAALAAAQVAGASPRQMLDGIARGYEATIRLGRSVGPGHYAKYHNTATCGPLGAAVAASDILGLSPDRRMWAMGNALTQASGFWACRHEDVMSKQLHTARAAEAGLAAALLARAGVSGPQHILEGPQGFYEGMCPDAAPDMLLADPEAWRIAEVSFKPWPACRHCHPAIDAALVLRDRVPDLAAVTRARIAVYGDAALFCDNAAPQTTVAAKFSLQHAVGLTLADGPPALSGFEPEALARADLRGFWDRAEVVTDPDLTARYPAHFGTKLSLTLADGTTIETHRADALGDPELPMSPDQLATKAQDLMAWAGLDHASADALISAAQNFAQASDLSPFLMALRQAKPPEVGAR